VIAASGIYHRASTFALTAVRLGFHCVSAVSGARGDSIRKGRTYSTSRRNGMSREEHRL